VHLELLRIHPFDAAAGRLARAAARLALRTGGLDPERLTAVEPVIAEDRLAHAEAVAATLRRRDLTLWLEGWAEVVADALRHARADLRAVLAGDGVSREDDAERDALARRLATLHAARAGEVVTLAEHRDAAGMTLAEARDDLERAIDLGLVVRVRGSGGLRHRLVEPLLS
jgi:Fic family protein